MNLKAGYPFSLIRYGLPYQYPKLTDALKTDVIIVGGGISGALTAYYLQTAGIDCAVIDGRSIGLGSTCASTSLLQYEIDVPLTELSVKIGPRDAARAYTLCLQSIGKLKAIADKVGLKEFAFNKSLYFAAYKKDTDFLHTEFSLRKAMGLPVTWLGAEDLKRDFGITAPAAILSDEGAYADAYLFTHALHQQGIHNGLRVFDRTFAKHISHHKNGVTLTTAENVTITAKKVVYATGYEVVEMIEKKIVKLQSTYATISEHMPSAGVVVNQDVMLWNTAKPYLYMRKTTDGRVIVGGRDEAFSSAAKRDKLIAHKSKLLTEDFKRLFPGTAFHPEFSWTGTFGSTADGLPYIGVNRQYDNGYFALGFGGNGITFSLIAAEIIADLLQGKKNEDARIFAFDRR